MKKGFFGKLVISLVTTLVKTILKVFQKMLRCFFLVELCPRGPKDSASSHFVAFIFAKMRGGAV